jgi:hypothetical protein
MIWGGESIGDAIKTMEKIRSQLISEYPDVKQLLYPIEYFDGFSLKEHEGIKEAHKIIAERSFISSQYAMLARYCDQNNYGFIEIGIEKDSHSHHLIKDYLYEFGNSNYRIEKDKAPKPIYDLLKYFSFPLLEFEKPDMENYARERGWLNLMYLTWFCRKPKNGKPCGFCGPCSDAAIHGMGKRLPLKARIVAFIQLPFRKWWRKNYKKQNTGILKHVKWLLRDKA